MASKQLGKLRQWGKEVIVSTKDKTTVTEEFKQLEKDVELRKAGIEKIRDVCAEYHMYLHKKKEYPHVEEGVKMLPIDALGVVMVAHGEEFGRDSAFGQCLTSFGRAQCKIATLQESFASFVRDRYITSLEKLGGDIEDYEMLRKKLDSRRLTYDAAVSKLSKAKKDKDIREAEDEHIKAKIRYEEASGEVQARMRRIQANELRQLKDLTHLLDYEVRFVTQCLAELREVQDNWCDESAIARRSGSPIPVAAHSFAHDQKNKAIASVSRRRTSRSNGQSVPNEDGDGSDDDDEESDNNSTGTGKSDAKSSLSRDREKKRHGSGSSSKASSIQLRSPSRAGSVSSNDTAHSYSSSGKRSRSESIPRRKRSDSATSSVASSASESSKRSGVTGWLSGSTRGKKNKEKRKDKDRTALRAFASLKNDDGSYNDDDGDGGVSQKSAESDSRSSVTNSTQRKSANSNTGTFNRALNTAQRPLSMNSSIKSLSSNSSFTGPRDIHGHGDLNNSYSVSSLGELPAKQVDGTVKRTNIAQRAELEMLDTHEYEPSLYSMDGDNVHTPLPLASTFSHVPFADVRTHHMKDRSLENNVDPAEPEDESGKEDDELLLGQDIPSAAFSVLPSPFETVVTDMPSISSQIGRSRIETGNASGHLIPQAQLRSGAGAPPPLPSRKQSARRVPPPPPPPPPYLIRRGTSSPSIAFVGTDGSSSSSSLNLNAARPVPSAPVGHPPPPPPRDRSRSVLIPESLTVSPFDN